MSRSPNPDIIFKFKQQIIGGKYDQTQFLPSERMLAREFGVGRGVIQTALRQLQKDGIIQLVPKRGACLSKSEIAQNAHPFKRLLVWYHRSFPASADECIGLLSGICAAAAENYAEAITSFAPVRHSADEIVERFRRGELQGVIYDEECDAPQTIRRLTSAGVPWVLCNHEGTCDAVMSRMDFREIGRIAARRLIQANHKKIAVIAGPLDKFIYQEILKGFRGALAEENIPLAAACILQYANPAEVTQNDAPVRELFSRDDRPTAVFTMRDNRAEILFGVCRTLAIEIPGDVSVISYDDVSWPAGRNFLTTVREPVDVLGRAAVELLHHWFMTGKRPQNRVIQGELVERSSIRTLLR